MQKTLKRLFVILMSAIAITCFALFAACQPNDDDEFKEEDGKIVITVVYPDGSPVNGHEDGTMFDTKLNKDTVVKVQFCTAVDAEGGACSPLYVLGENGKIKLDIQKDILSMFGTLDDDVKLELHIQGITGYIDGLGGDYGTFTKNSFPHACKVTLKAE